MKNILNICLSILFFSLIFAQNNNATSCIQSDSLALVQLYNTTNGADWNVTWDLTEPVMMWNGVTLHNDGETCGVKYLALPDNNLTGILPDLNLPQLELLYLQSNQLEGNIPAFSALTSLRRMSLYNNQLSGNLPNFDLPNLQKLTVYSNVLSGSIPNFDNLPKLKELVVHNNQLSGSIPNFDHVPQLQYIYANNNQLTGNVPNFNQVPNLIILCLSDNQLTGNIPNFANVPNLLELLLSANQLSGDIPNFDNLDNLERLYLDNNQLVGNIPNFDSLTHLEHLHLYTNALVGEIPDFDNLPALEQLYLGYNLLENTIPNFDNLTNLERLCLEYNNLTGNIPDFNNSPNISILLLQHNQLQGCYAAGLLDLNLSFYDFSDNPGLPNLGTSDSFMDFHYDTNSQYGLACDDGNPNTNNEVILSDCSCGVKVSCPDLELTGTVEEGSYLAGGCVTSDATVTESSSVIYSAEGYVDLLPGFDVPMNTDFSAQIAPCDSLMLSTEE